jgi:hypothetical protein
MHRAHPFRIAILVIVAALALPVASASAAGPGAASGPSAAPAGVPMDLLPDLIMAKPYGWDLITRPNGQKRLTFGTIGWNVGQGPLELNSTRPNADDEYMVVRQRIYDSEGGSRTRRTSAVMFYEAGDHHTHWHTRQFMHVELYKFGEPDGDVYGIRKIGYCLLDARRQASPAPGSPATRVYELDACGDEDSMSLVTGLSVGWGDDYPPNYAHQWINITDLPVGRYRVCTTVDPFDEFVELDETNNQRWVDVRVNIPLDRVRVIPDSGAIGPCGPDVLT